MNLPTGEMDDWRYDLNSHTYQNRWDKKLRIKAATIIAAQALRKDTTAAELNKHLNDMAVRMRKRAGKTDRGSAHL